MLTLPFSAANQCRCSFISTAYQRANKAPKKIYSSAETCLPLCPCTCAHGTAAVEQACIDGGEKGRHKAHHGWTKNFLGDLYTGGDEVCSVCDGGYGLGTRTGTSVFHNPDECSKMSPAERMAALGLMSAADRDATQWSTPEERAQAATDAEEAQATQLRDEADSSLASMAVVGRAPPNGNLACLPRTQCSC